MNFLEYYLEGSYQRDSAEEIEKLIVEFYNGTSSDDSELCAKAVELKHIYGGTAQWIGKEYDSPGDIKLVDTINNKSVFIESKYITNGTGTRSNPSQDLLELYKIFPDIHAGWKQFRNSEESESGSGFQARRITILEKTFKIKFTTNAQIEKYGRALRDYTNEGIQSPLIAKTITPKKAGEVLQQIKDLSTDDKSKYLSYIFSHKQDPKQVRQLYYDLMFGKNTIKQRANISSKYELLTFYINKTTDSVIVHSSNNVKTDIVESSFALEWDGNSTSFKLLVDNIPKIRFSLHWGNIGQGWKTPCYKIFIIGALNESEITSEGFFYI